MVKFLKVRMRAGAGVVYCLWQYLHLNGLRRGLEGVVGGVHIE